MTSHGFFFICLVFTPLSFPVGHVSDIVMNFLVAMVPKCWISRFRLSLFTCLVLLLGGRLLLTVYYYLVGGLLGIACAYGS
jgi:hypothetical protein